MIIHWLLCIDYLYILCYLQLQFWHSCWSRIQKQPPEMFLMILQFQWKNLYWSFFFTKLQAFRPATLLKRDSYTGNFLWKLRNLTLTSEHVFWKTSERLLLCIDYFIIYWFLQCTTAHPFQFYKKLLYYAIKTIELRRVRWFFWRSISLNEFFSFWKLKISFTEIFN